MDSYLRVIKIFKKCTEEGLLIWHREDGPLGNKCYKAYLSEVGEEKANNSLIGYKIRLYVSVLAIGYFGMDFRLKLKILDDNNQEGYIDANHSNKIKIALEEFFNVVEKNFYKFHIKKIFCSKCKLKIESNI